MREMGRPESPRTRYRHFSYWNFSSTKDNVSVLGLSISGSEGIRSTHLPHFRKNEPTRCPLAQTNRGIPMMGSTPIISFSWGSRNTYCGHAMVPRVAKPFTLVCTELRAATAQHNSWQSYGVAHYHRRYQLDIWIRILSHPSRSCNNSPTWSVFFANHPRITLAVLTVGSTVTALPLHQCVHPSTGHSEHHPHLPGAMAHVLQGETELIITILYLPFHSVLCTVIRTTGASMHDFLI